MLYSVWRRVYTSALLLVLAGAAHPSFAQAINPAQWAPELRAFARQDSLTPPPRRPVLFYGSSSIRKWETLRQDFPGRPVLNRGFGGSRFPDALYFFDQLVAAYRPRQVVLYEGDNDIGSGATPQEVFQSFRDFERLMQQKLPKVPVVFLAIKPSPSRWALYPQVQEANRLIREYIGQHPKRLRFVDTATPLLGANGKPQPQFYVADSLHMTPAGYAVWKEVVGKALKR
ncbi:lysophospholipase L1-like esterase [Hymenobacter luteus]|uniref:Lysophospholipase L1-like esterase n=2 Tax=Hymenobacter TaxID=89966 RepID=A0A7W9WDH5_9BACT|nr:MULTISPECIES: SGNH/GDSL hydrolase family protein [Hymenobacter]MBB4602505.1 lysophospholipase L1-like esterase [Hymenobacter latericoloratus]MBB6060396.1 lysophospholipase L1-like esterase [Hymenobacter luteus]